MSVHRLIVGGTRAGRMHVADALSRSWMATPGESRTLDASTWPFVRPVRAAAPTLYRVDDLEAAFSSRQVRSRLVLTQPSYVLQAWLDVLKPADRLIMTADVDRLCAVAPEVCQQSGPWRVVTIDSIDALAGDVAEATTSLATPSCVEGLLATALQEEDAIRRLSACRLAAGRFPGSAAAELAVASASRDAGDFEGARRALDAALTNAADWAAAHFEDGKFWLSADDLPRARDAFRRAVDLMPAFTGALSNLGAVCGELGETDAAAAYFARVLNHDPDDVGALNNVGVLNRELGQMETSEAALVRLTTLAPGFVFGHYNLGHTRFLRGNFRAALDAYEEGRRRDPENNRRQSARLAMVRWALHEYDEALRQLQQAVRHAPSGEYDDILHEARDIARWLCAGQPLSERLQQFVEQLDAMRSVRPRP